MKTVFQSSLLAAVLSLTLATHAPAHALIDHAAPPVGGTVREGPVEVSVWFNEKVEAGFSSVKVFDASGKEVDKKTDTPIRKMRVACVFRCHRHYA